MIERQQLKFPSILFQFLDAFFAQEPDDKRFRLTLDYLSVTEEELRDPNYVFDGDQVFRMLELLRNTSVYEPASLRVLQHASISNVGMAGIAGLTADNLGDALAIAMKVSEYFMPVATITLEESDEAFRMEAVLNADFGASGAIILEIILGALKLFADELTGEQLNATLEFAHSPTFGRDKTQTRKLYEKHLHCKVAFGCASSGFIFHPDFLKKRLKRQNPMMHSFASDMLDRELDQQSPVAPVTHKVRALLEEAMEKESPMSLDDLADTLHMSSRTLSRKLAKEDAQYKTLLNEVRFERAKTLLKQPDTSIKQLASKLGFANSDAFSRAFKAYTGISPMQWKNRH